MKKRIIPIILVLVVLLSYSVSAGSPYKSYVYDANGFFALAPDAFRFEKSFDLNTVKDKQGKSIGSLAAAKDLNVISNGDIYITDTDNQRIVVLNSDFTLDRVISGFKNTITDETGKKVTFEDTFSLPTCTFVDENDDNSIYICDQNGATLANTDASKADAITEGTSGRVIQLDKNGNLKRVISGITSTVLPEGFIFQPTDIAVDSAGRIFILSYMFNMGIMELDEFGEFVQCLGAPAVTYNAIELIWRSFSTKEQLDRMENFVPTEYSGIDIDEDGFIYVTNSTFTKSDASTVAGLSRLNAKGKNVLRKMGSDPYGDVIKRWTGTYKGPSRLTDVITLDYGIYAVLDELRGKVFFYNSDGINLFEFGTKPDVPDTVHTVYLDGTLTAPVSIGWVNDSCLVLDTELNCINIYSMTDYAKLITRANMLHNTDKYDEEIDCWNRVLELNINNNAAKQNIAKVYYKDGEYETAMGFFKEIGDQDNYSKAYKYQRQSYIEKYFGWGVAALVILIILIIIIKKLWRKFIPPVKDHSYLSNIKYAKSMMFRPLNASWFLIRENHSSIASATTILGATALMSLLQARFTGFVFDMNAEYVSIISEILKIVAPLLLFCVCNWCVTSLMNGEGNFKAIYISSCYSLTPILFFYPIAILLSNIMVKEEGDFYTAFITLALFYVLILIFASNMRIHDFSLGMTVVELFITVVVMLLVIFLGVLFFALVQQMVDFVSNIIEELATR